MTKDLDPGANNPEPKPTVNPAGFRLGVFNEEWDFILGRSGPNLGALLIKERSAWYKLVNK